MDEDNSVKAPVTRLRRRLSVEQSEEVNSPGPATPTKKRGRLAAKPQLELIVENAPESSSSKQSTKKAPLKELVEAAEEKPITPSRRSTRIKSNTSIVSETTQSVNSPRAKRAARRTSQVGSDNESAVTPARQTRRTRKDSTSSIDKLETTLSTKPNNISQIIIEETDINTQKTNDSSNDIENLSLRKSPRLMGKKQKKFVERHSIETTQEQTDSTSNSNISELIAKPDIYPEQAAETPVVTDTEIDKTDKTSGDLSDTSLNMIKNLDKKPKNKSSNPNKSTSDLDNSKSSKGKRHRAKSLNAISLSAIKDNDFHSDNEITKRTIKSGQHSKELSVNEHHFGSGDNALTNQSKSLNSSKRKSIKDTDLNKSTKNESMYICETENKLPGVVSQNESLNVTSKEPTEIISPQGNKENIIVESIQDTTDLVTNLLGKPPSINLQTKIFFEDLDTDNKSEAKLHVDSEDQCVPVVETRHCEIAHDACNLTPSKSGIKIKEAEINLGNSSFFKREKEMVSKNDSCEPMDVDETLPNNITISEISQLNKSSDSLNRKSIVSSPQIDISLNKSTNKLKNRSSNSFSASQNLETKSESLQLNISSDPLNQKSIVSSPQVDNSLNKSSNKSKRKTSQSTSQNNITDSEILQQNETFNPENQKAIETFLQIDNSLNKSSNKSKRKSSNSLSVTQNFEKSGTENKSTLILSQLKDTSSSENTVSKSPSLCHEVLSKSTRGKAVDKEDYSTSTPLQQKSLKKLGLQINSSIIDTSNNECKKSDRTPKSSKKDRSALSEQAEHSSSTEEESEIEEGSETEEESDTEEESSRTKSGLLDYEVDVASDNYESGDSRDEEEKQYEAEHEIIEKGETLDSDEEEDISDDSDYERDSFVVSSAEEDSDLLSGSGDDLSMSDNELTMSKKSKKKYNERKLKEQKKASKEMFEARHKLDKSASKIAKKKSQKLESSDDSEDEDVAPMKKQRHQRLNSTNDDSSNEALTNKAVSKKKTKKRLLSESDESVDIENEITVFNNSALQNDPLLMQVKEEPKTPVKDLNISTVQINENIEEVEVENNISYTKTNQTLDPLHATEMEDCSSSLSESSEIMNNYDSILNQLNTENKQTTVKSHDISLNLCKKTKKAKEPIVDELNITHTKKLKNNKNKSTIDVVDAPQSLKKKQKKLKQDKISDDKDSSSDSIDLQLLFSEDSNDYNSEKTPKIEENEHNDAADDFIPLKRTPGKINILSGQNDEPDSNNEFHIIIDTQGTRKSTNESSNVSLNTSSKKKKNAENDDDDTPMEIPFKSTKNDKYRKLSQGGDMESNRSMNDGDISITGSAKKKKKHSLTPNEQADVNVIETSEQHLGSAKKINKMNTLGTNPAENKNEFVHNLSRESMKNQKNTLNNEGLLAGQLSNSKKRKRKSSANVPIENDIDIDNSQVLDKSQTLNASISTGRQKKKRKISEKIVIDESEDKEVVTVKATDNQINKANTGEKSTDQIIISEMSQTSLDQEGSQKKKNKKRKRDDDDENKTSKVLKENSFDKVHISRLPASFLNQLEDKPKKTLLDMKKSSVVSTTTFNVQETVKRKNKPSNFLEESVYLNESPDKKKQKSLMKKPKVLPFVPTAATSGSGFTTNFKINVLPQEIKFVAQTKNVTNFKNDYLYGQKIQRLGTYEMYKKHRKAKLSKF